MRNFDYSRLNNIDRIKKKVSPSTIRVKEIKALIAEGKSGAEIADELGMKSSNLYHFMKAYSIEIPKENTFRKAKP